MIIFNYPSKKALKECIGQRPHITGKGREFFANVTMQNGIIRGVK